MGALAAVFLRSHLGKHCSVILEKIHPAPEGVAMAGLIHLEWGTALRRVSPHTTHAAHVRGVGAFAAR